MKEIFQKEKKHPSVRFLVFGTIGVTILLLISIFSYIFFTSMPNMLAQSENELTHEQIDLVADILTTSTNNIQAVTRSWSSWSETYNFVLGENLDYIQFFEEMRILDQNNYNFIVIKDLSGNDLYVDFYDFEAGKRLPAPEGFTNYLSSLAAFMLQNYDQQSYSHFSKEIGKDGLILYNDSVYYVCSMPILMDDEASPPIGSFFFGRFIDNHAIKDIANRNDMNFTILDSASSEITNLNIDFNKNSTDALDSDSVVIKSKNSLSVYKLMNDFYGNKNIVLKVEKQRSLYKNGLKSIQAASTILYSVTLMLAGILFYLIERSILRPLQRISSDVQAVADSSVLLDSDKYSISREFHTLSTSINEMLNRLSQSRLTAEQSIISLNTLENILNGMDAYLYVSDPNTDEILFINDQMRKHFNLKEDAVGSICWKVLQLDFEQRCDFCPNSKLLENPDVPITWYELNTVTGRYYKNIDGIINWTNGRKVHLQHSVDITDLKLAEDSLKKQLRQQELMSAISQSFISNDETDNLINNALKITGEFMEVSRIILVQYNENEHALAPKYEWNSGQYTAYKQLVDKLPFDPDIPPYDSLLQDGGNPIIINNVNENTTYKELKKLIELGTKAFMSIPLYVSGNLWGFLEFDYCKEAYNWSDSDVYLGNFITNALSTVINRQNMEVNLLRMSSVIISSPQYISYINSEGQFDFFNPATLDVTGYSQDELMAGGVQLLYDEQTNQLIKNEIMPKIFSLGKYNFELPLIRKDGKIRIMSFSAFTIGADGYGLIASDITEQKQLENDLVSAKNAAEQASRAKGEFLSRMSHETRTPMNAIIGMTNIARNSKVLEKKDYCLEKIDNASKHLLGVINDILDMSKIEARKFDLSLHEFNFEKMLMNITNLVNFRAEEKMQNIVVNVDKNVPVSIIGDEMRFSQVITNLMTNAIKFTPVKGTIILNVNRIAETEGVSTLQIEIIDNGIGISEEAQLRLFSSFEQADGSTARKYGGTGLGLAISKHIVELMDGKIWVESELNKGSKFIFTIKVENGKDQPQQKLSSVISRENIHILAVDDSLETREYFLHVMEAFGLPCDVAADGLEALDMIKNCKDKPYNIMFIDWQMPYLNGIELAAKIKQITKNNAVVIMISVAEWSDIKKDAISAGIDRFISKPLFPSVLINTINECLGAAAADKLTQSSTTSYDFKNHALLLAEDIEVNREILIGTLEDTGISIDCAENGTQAVNIFKQNPNKYSLILMDIHMPEMDGYEATQLIRSFGYSEAKEIPIIAMTANVFKEDIERCLEAGMNDHIGKPLNADELLTKLNKYLPTKTNDLTKNAAYKPIEFDNSKASQPSHGYADFLPFVDVQDGLGRLMNNKKLYFTLLKNFKGRQMVDELIKNNQDNDFVKTAQAAHALKGASANLGLIELTKISANIEAQAKMEMEVVQLITNINETVDRTVLAINNLLKSEGIE